MRVEAKRKLLTDRIMLHGYFVRSPHPHARIRAIDTAAALAIRAFTLR
jgi:CO/xanthine dehydrogenase Mo-binding subunit